MKFATVANLKANLSSYLRVAERGPVIITRDGKPAGVLLAINDEEELERLMLAHSPRLRTILNAARQRVRAGKAMKHEDFWGQFEDNDRREKVTPRPSRSR